MRSPIHPGPRTSTGLGEELILMEHFPPFSIADCIGCSRWLVVYRVSFMVIVDKDGVELQKGSGESTRSLFKRESGLRISARISPRDCSNPHHVARCTLSLRWVAIGYDFQDGEDESIVDRPLGCAVFRIPSLAHGTRIHLHARPLRFNSYPASCIRRQSGRLTRVDRMMNSLLRIETFFVRSLLLLSNHHHFPYLRHRWWPVLLAPFILYPGL